MTCLYSFGRNWVSASLVSYMWLSASKTSKSSACDGMAGSSWDSDLHSDRTAFLTVVSTLRGPLNLGRRTVRRVDPRGPPPAVLARPPPTRGRPDRVGHRRHLVPPGRPSAALAGR